ncbi:30S ribosomal protein S19 [Candidatus Woesearchaeota archaeon]|jgi:small subunit ribosomal protein S19|nr:30S ribosomal protein S19 [Candidatus Woesearchaeota archaeon]MBT4368717.1 30S ribosomal protein S19 [Candidatus Woesearchaeota archaeon]MBT4712006.1 30S ribosomal protein S19 [Candidatus Woesearchaeota archaeon]MBT6638901.1 30S ribosomal protein S19 [Candidatus Woesearchaeota archaeon]MBT7134545.1 30S ribosomal protein S19 [Candidatus Woesearchaeota archaeon]
MAKKIFKYRGKTTEELKAMPLKEFITLLPTRARRTLTRGLTDEQKKFMTALEKGNGKLKTHSRGIIILPSMIDKTISVYSGKSFEKIIITEEMIGYRLGDFVLTRKRLAHSAPGVGATRSSSAVSVK